MKSLVLALVVALGGAALAHPDHKIVGTVTHAAADHVMMKDRAGKDFTVKIVKTTKITRNKKAFKAADITAGTRVVVTVVSDENLTAKLIEVGVLGK